MKKRIGCILIALCFAAATLMGAAQPVSVWATDYSDFEDSYFEDPGLELKQFDTVKVESRADYTYDGKNHLPKITGLPEGATVVYAANGDDNFTPEPEFRDAGYYRISYIISHPEYEDMSGMVVVNIMRAPILKYSSKVKGLNTVSSGKYYKIGAKPKVTIAGLKEGVDFTVTYENNNSVGQAALYIMGKGNYSSMITKYFNVSKTGKIPQTIWRKDGVIEGNMSQLMAPMFNFAKTKSTYKIANTKIAKLHLKTINNATKNIVPKKPGITYVTIKAAGNAKYEAATQKIKIIIRPGYYVPKLTPGKNKMTVKWAARATFEPYTIHGFRIQYTTDKNWEKNVKTITIKNPKAKSRVIKNLKSGKVYYVKVLAYTNWNGQCINGAVRKYDIKSIRVK